MRSSQFLKQRRDETQFETIQKLPMPFSGSNGHALEKCTLNLFGPSGPVAPAHMHGATRAQKPAPLASIGEAYAQGDRPLTSLCCSAGLWFWLCSCRSARYAPDLSQEVARGASTVLRALRHLVALTSRSRACWSGTTRPARGSVTRFTSRPCSRSRPRLPSAPRAPVLERSHSLSPHRRAAAILAPRQPCRASCP